MTVSSWQVTVVVGNPKPGSRTLHVAEHVAGRLCDDLGATQSEVIDLATYATAMFQWPDPEFDRLCATVSRSRLAVVASPTYKASYTGLLKGFFDRYGDRELTGVIAVPVMTGADNGHAMAPDLHLRPLLVELGASVPTGSLYVPIELLDRIDDVVLRWTDQNASVLAGLRAAAATQL